MKKQTIQQKHLLNATFLNKEGKIIKVSDIIDQDDCWFLKRTNSWIVTHNGIKQIAKEAGISSNYDVEESANVIPDYRNELEYIVRVTIKCNAKKEKKQGCIHSDEDFSIATGEANRVNTPNRGRGFLRKMAEKRAFDIAVLEHLNLYTTVFSEEESSDFQRNSKQDTLLMPGSQEFERIVEDINAILNSKDIADLKKVKKQIKTKIKNKEYSDKQIEYLRILYKEEMVKKETSF